MNRFLAAFLVAACMLGAVGAAQMRLARGLDVRWTRETETPGPASDSKAPRYALAFVASFDAEQDPFAVRLDTASETPRLKVTHEGRTVFQRVEDFRAGETLTASNLNMAGASVRLHVEAAPAPDQAARPCALRVRLLRDGHPIDEATLWSSGGGQALSGEVELSVRPTPTGDDAS